MITLKDISIECGCSVTSVSRALKNSDTISKKLRELVQQKAREMEYIPNALARSMRTGQTQTIALLIQDLRNPFYALLAKYIESYASSKGYGLFIMATNEDSSHEYECVIKAMQQNVDGILLMPEQKDAKSVYMLKDKNFPFVLVGRAFDDIETDAVLVDDVHGAYLGTEHLIKSGHKRILFINSLAHIHSTKLRLLGYQKALKHYNIEEQSKDIHYISMQKGDTKVIIEKIFSQKNDYTAILCFCDLMAFEAINALNSMGYNIPKDIAIVSNDDIHSDIIMPIKLTSASFSRDLMSKYCIDLLINNIENPSTRSEKEQYVRKYMDVTLTVGQTT